MNEEKESTILTRRQFLIAAAATTGAKLAPNLFNDAEALEPKNKTQQIEQTTSVESVIIDGVETFGHDEIITEEKLRELVKELNDTPEHIEDNIYYGTIFISKELYNRFSSENNEETIQSFISSHSEEFSKMLQESQPPTGLEYQLRRLIVVEKQDINYPASFHEGWMEYGIYDCDGTFFIPDDYDPENSSYIRNGIDYGLIHEWGHTILHLNDAYLLDVTRKSIVQSLLEKLPENWRDYFQFKRNDLGRDVLMSDVGKKLGIYDALQLNRRIDHHDFETNFKDYLGWPPEFSPVDMVFTKDGEKIDVQRVEFYRSELESQQEILTLKDLIAKKQSITPLQGEITEQKIRSLVQSKSIPAEATLTIEGEVENFDPGQLFTANKDGFVSDDESTALVFIYDKQGSLHFRWMDIRDFNIPHWKQTTKMTVEVNNPNMVPENFNWTIGYEAKPISPTAIPSATSTPIQPSPSATHTDKTPTPVDTATYQPPPDETATATSTPDPSRQPSRTQTPPPPPTATERVRTWFKNHLPIIKKP